MLNPVHLRTLTVVLRLGSFADAARDLGYTASAVSQQMSVLERQVGLVLFERDAHGVRPTSSAGQVAQHATLALGALRQLEREIELISTGVLGQLRIGSFPTASDALLPGALARLERDRPGLEVSLDEGEPDELIAMLEGREIDVAVLYRYPCAQPRMPGWLDVRHVVTERLMLIHRDAKCEQLNASGSVDLGLLSDASWISTREGTGGASTLSGLCRSAGFEPRVSYRSNNYSVVQSLVASGLGVAVVPAIALQAGLNVRARQLSDTAARRDVLVASAPTSHRDLVDSFERAVRRSTSECLDGGGGMTVEAEASVRHAKADRSVIARPTTSV